MTAEDAPLSPFRRRVLAAVARIPHGRVTTYRLLGDHLGCRGYRAIGQALRHNPWAPRVPCHRVIASDLGIAGFAGETGGQQIRRKLALLAEEGVTFAAGKLAESQRLFRFDEND